MHKSVDYSTCTCGKRSYHCRRDASKAKRSQPQQKHLTVYRCAYTGQLHLGHTPEALRRGDISRDELAASQRNHHPVAA